MFQRPSSTCGFDSRTETYNGVLLGPRNRRETGTVTLVSTSGAVKPAAELYNSLAQLDDSLELTPPPAYELLDPNSAMFSQLSTTDSSTSNTAMTPLAPEEECPSAGLSSRRPQRAPRGPRPLLTNRSHSDQVAAVSATASAEVPGVEVPEHVPSSSARDHGVNAQPLPADNTIIVKPGKTRQKLVKYRPPPPHIVHQEKVRQVYQSPVFYPFSPSENLPHNRPPLSNASRANKNIRPKNVQRSSCIEFRPNAAALSPPSTHEIHLEAEDNRPGLTGSAQSPRQVNRDEVAAPSGRGATHSRTAQQTPLAPFICPECRFRFCHEHLLKLHLHLTHTPHRNSSKQSGTTTTPTTLPSPLPRAPSATLARSDHAVEHTHLPAGRPRNIYQADYFT